MNGVIYQILNSNTGKVYIGSTVDFKNRKRQHLQSLRKNSHYNNKLQKSFNKHGESVFEFSELCHCINGAPPFEAEQEVLDQRRPYENGYNLGLAATAGMLGRHCSPEKKRKISLARKGKYTGADNWFFGKKHSPETRQKMSALARSRTAEKNPMFGKTWTQAQRDSQFTKRICAGQDHYMFGNKISPKIRLKMSIGKRTKTVARLIGIPYAANSRFKSEMFSPQWPIALKAKEVT